MPRITISINASGTPKDQELLSLDAPSDLTISSLKGMIEAETEFPASSQTLFFNGNALRTDTLTLEEANVKDGEMLAVMIRSNPSPPQQNPARQQGRPPRHETTEADSPQAIENIRQQILNNPQQLASLIQAQPQLAQAIHDQAQFRDVWMRALQERDRVNAQRQADIEALNDDPFNIEAQKRIEEMIRQEKIEANLQYAYEHNPEVFARVSMLYVPVRVNDRPVKAFVDSGAQTTIMSPDCAEACGLTYLIDPRFGGVARGVGTAKILGRVHQAKIQIGDAELDCSFTVMEGKDVDLLFGLDMLRRHQACIDLMAGELRFPHTSVKFLGESEIPKGFEDRMVDEPTVKAPNGLEVGANTGSVRPAGTAEQAHQQINQGESSASGSGSVAQGKTPMGARPLSQAPPARPQQAPSAATPPQNAASSGSSVSRPAPQQQMQWPEKDIESLIGLGFDRQRAIDALNATNGHVEYAAGLLFQ